MSPLSNHPVRPDKPWRSQAAMNEPRPKAEADRLERWMQVCINAGELDVARELLEASDGEQQ